MFGDQNIRVAIVVIPLRPFLSYGPQASLSEALGK